MAPAGGQQRHPGCLGPRQAGPRRRATPRSKRCSASKSRATGPIRTCLRLEYRREVFRWAARQVRKEFRQDTWDAFWLTAVEGRSVEVVAKELAKDAGAIYAARSRIMRRIREKVTEYEQET